MNPPLTTRHKIIFKDAKDMSEVKDESIHLVVTSPPYPMIAMWDEVFGSQNPEIKDAIVSGSGQKAFELMHLELDKVWSEAIRVLIPGGFICINIGDAARTLEKDFSLYNNHSRITSFFIRNGLSNLPNIIWRKATNAPNKYMGSGMLPAGAYVTLEHEYVLIFRKGGKRKFSLQESRLRQESAYFWEERNQWFSDLWEIIGARQKMAIKAGRDRNGAFPFEVPYRLINMYSIKYDWVLDPFLGTGSTMAAALSSQRNSIGYEIDASMKKTIMETVGNKSLPAINGYLGRRIKNHCEFVETKTSSHGRGFFRHINKPHGTAVVSAQEKEITIRMLKKISAVRDSEYEAEYNEIVDSWNQGYEPGTHQYRLF